MSLQIPGIQQIFPHSKEFDQGLGRERRGQATATVSQDGTGDFADIQEALNFLPSDGGTVFIKDGNYNSIVHINILKSNTAIIGAGKSTKIIFGLLAGFVIGDVSNILIENITFTGLTTSDPGIGAISTAVGSTPTEVTVRNCYFVNLRYGMNIGHGQFLIDGCLFDAVGLTDSKPSINLGTTKGIVVNNIFIDCPWYALTINTTANENMISNNIFDNSIKSGINTNGDDCVFSNNIFINNDEDGIRMLGADNNVISGNQCNNNGGYGINISNNTCDKNIVIGNSCQGNTTGAINDAGTNTHPNGASGTTNLALDDLNIIA